MKVYTKEELTGMDADVIDDILGEMGVGRRYLAAPWSMPHRDCTEDEESDDAPFGGYLVAVNLSDPTIRETVVNLLAASYEPSELPEASTVIMDIEGGYKVRNLSINVYTLDSYKEKCRQHLEDTGVELSHLDEETVIGMNAVIGVFESFAAECEANTSAPADTI